MGMGKGYVALVQYQVVQGQLVLHLLEMGKSVSGGKKKRCGWELCPTTSCK